MTISAVKFTPETVSSSNQPGIISSRTMETYCARIVAKLERDGMKELRKYAIGLKR